MSSFGGMNLAKSLIVTNKNHSNHCATNGSFWPKISPIYTFRLHRTIRYIVHTGAHSIQLRNRTTAQTEYLMGVTVNNSSEFWVYKLSFLKRHQLIQRTKRWNNMHLSRYKRNTPSVEATPPLWLIEYREKNDSDSRLSMDSNCRPQFSSFELYC
jgi:hypothetical protein